MVAAIPTAADTWADWAKVTSDEFTSGVPNSSSPTGQMSGKELVYGLDE